MFRRYYFSGISNIFTNNEKYSTEASGVKSSQRGYINSIFETWNIGMEHLFYYLAYLFDVCSNIASTKLTSSKISLTGAKSGE